MSVWTDDKVAELKRLFKEGHSDQEISKRIRISRNGVIGKRHRLGLSREEAAKKLRGRPRLKVLPQNDPDPRDDDHAIDARDLAILDEMAKGRPPAAIGKDFKVPETYVRELWRVREAQNAVGEPA